MNKTLLTIFCLFATGFVFGQTISYGIKGGINFSSQTTIITPIPTKTGSITGFNIGGLVEFEYPQYSIQSGIFYTTKGEKISSQFYGFNGNYAGPYTANLKLTYFEVPINFLYNVKLSNKLSLHAGGGPYIAFEGPSNVTQTSNPVNNQPRTEAISEKNPDFGLNFLVGFKLKNRVIADAQYGIGLANLAASTATERNRVISFSVGYMFK